jgi:L-fuculose-phosphate aldolase
MNPYLIKELQQTSASMFAKNYFDLFHGSISAKIDIHGFIINKKETILNQVEESDFIRLTSNTRRDYRWKDATPDSEVHAHIYSALPNAKYICYTIPPYATAYSLDHKTISPIDYYGQSFLKDVEVYDPGNFDDWDKRAPSEIAHYFETHKSNILLIRGFGVVAYHRNLLKMVKKVAILENACRLLSIKSIHE